MAFLEGKTALVTGEGSGLGEAIARRLAAAGLQVVLADISAEKAQRAAGFDVTAPLEELEINDWRRVLDTNLHGPFVLSKLALPLLKKSVRGTEAGGGQIVNIASTAATQLQDPANVAEAVHFLLTMPPESVVSEILVLPKEETSWP